LRLAGLLLAAPLALTACGQKGPLFLPDEGVKTPIEIRGPGVAPATTAPPPAAASPETNEEKNKPPAAVAAPTQPPAG
jgi:predicted small lipoprotein YifL